MWFFEDYEQNKPKSIYPLVVALIPELVEDEAVFSESVRQADPNLYQQILEYQGLILLNDTCLTCGIDLEPAKGNYYEYVGFGYRMDYTVPHKSVYGALCNNCFSGGKCVHPPQYIANRLKTINDIYFRLYKND